MQSDACAFGESRRYYGELRGTQDFVLDRGDAGACLPGDKGFRNRAAGFRRGACGDDPAFLVCDQQEIELVLAGERNQCSPEVFAGRRRPDVMCQKTGNAFRSDLLLDAIKGSGP